MTLPCGGNLLIEPVRTLTAIDVNSADRDAQGRHGADGADRQSRGRARGAARSWRCAISAASSVVDFIDLENRNKREQVMEALRAAAAIDPAIEWVGNMSRLGLVEILRRRAWSDPGGDVERRDAQMASKVAKGRLPDLRQAGGRQVQAVLLRRAAGRSTSTAGSASPIASPARSAPTMGKTAKINPNPRISGQRGEISGLDRSREF